MSSSSEALYQPIPQAPVASLPLLLNPEETDVDEEAPQVHTPTQVDPRIKWIHFMMGAAVLLPWNALITATPYFLSRLQGSPMQATFSSYLSISFTAINFFVLAHATATSDIMTSSRRVLLSTLWLTVLVFALTLSTYFNVSPGVFFAFVIINGIAQASAGSYLQTAVIAVASLFGPQAMQPVMSGQAAVGVVVSAVQVISASASIHTEGLSVEAALLEEYNAETRAAFWFFSLSTLFLIATIFSHIWLVRLPMYREVVTPLVETKRHSRQISSASHTSSLSPFDDKGRIWRVFKANVMYEIAVAYVFTVTLAVFPPITTSVRPVNPNFNPLLFNAIHFLLFNVGDFTGRWLCSFPSLLIWSRKKLMTISFLRTIFIPLFLACNVQRPSAPSSPTIPLSTPIINSDIVFFLILLLFGLSNGYVSSLCMIAAPSIEHNDKLKGRRDDVDAAATIASFCLVAGLAIGSALSFAVSAAVCQCNPFRG